MVFGPFSFLNTPVSKDLSSAVRLWGTPSSRITTVTLPVLVSSGVGLNLKFWIETVCSPAAAEVLDDATVLPVEDAVVDGVVVPLLDDFLSSPPHAARPRTATNTSATTAVGRVKLRTAHLR